MAESVPQHVDLFRRLRPFLRRDLTASAGIPNPIAGQILNWFDPANEEYLARVDDWQKMLCRQTVVNPPPFISSEEFEFNETPRFVAAVHQVAKLVYKWHGTPAKETDWSEVASRLSNPLPIRLTDGEVAGIRKCLSGICPIDLNQAVGRFGPGATAEGFNAADKWFRRGFIPDVPPSLYRCSPRDAWSPAGTLGFRCTKAAEVPKSIKCNRIVSSEPAMSMFAQLAVNDLLVDQIHHHFVGHVSLHDQAKHNRLLRRDGMATLDLSDASDHVSADLVERVLPQLWPVLAKVRSEYTLLPNVGVIPLRTHAPMGAGTCFSVMTTVILGIIAYAFDSMHYRWKSEPWSVYGDDIIVPIWICDYVIDLLERAGLVINIAKSCTTGRYVESCGLELYHGCDVTPVYLKDDLSTYEASKLEVVASKWCDLFPSTLDEVLKLADPVRGTRFNHDLQEQELLVRTRSARSKIAKLDGYPGLNRWFSVGTQQECQLRENGFHTRPSGVELEVWTKIAWRYRSAINYPHLALWFATRA
jgi:hypothetical protein